MTPNEYLASADCYTCLGLTVGQALVLAKLKAIIVKLDPTMPTDTQSLMNQGSCFTCLGLSQFETLQIVMLNIIGDLVGGGGSGCVICGEGDPVDPPPANCLCAWYINLLNSQTWYWDRRVGNVKWYQFG